MRSTESFFTIWAAESSRSSLRVGYGARDETIDATLRALGWRESMRKQLNDALDETEMRLEDYDYGVVSLEVPDGKPLSVFCFPRPAMKHAE